MCYDFVVGCATQGEGDLSEQISSYRKMKSCLLLAMKVRWFNKLARLVSEAEQKHLS